MNMPQFDADLEIDIDSGPPEISMD